MKVSIIVPVYNSEKYLDKCIESLIKQTYQNTEIILINDGSHDRSIEIMKFYQKKHKNIVIIDDTNHGQGYARNRGIDICTGELITFVDSDDYLDLNMIERLVDNLHDSDMVVCNATKKYSKKEVTFKNYYNFGTDQINVMLSHPGPWAKLYRKELIDDIRFESNLFYEDLLFTIQVAKRVNKVSFVNDELYYYVIHENSIMHKKAFTEKFNDIFIILDKVDRELVDYQKENEYLHIEHLFYTSVLRYIDYNAKNELNKINEIMKKYPNFRENIYFKKKSFKFRLICILASKKYYFLLKILKKFKSN